MPGADFGLSKLSYVPSLQLSLRLLNDTHITFSALASCLSISLEGQQNIQHMSSTYTIRRKNAAAAACGERGKVKHYDEAESRSSSTALHSLHHADRRP